MATKMVAMGMRARTVNARADDIGARGSAIWAKRVTSPNWIPATRSNMLSRYMMAIWPHGLANPLEDFRCPRSKSPPHLSLRLLVLAPQPD